MFLRRTTATRSEREREVATVFRRDRGEKRDGKERRRSFLSESFSNSFIDSFFFLFSFFRENKIGSIQQFETVYPQWRYILYARKEERERKIVIRVRDYRDWSLVKQPRSTSSKREKLVTYLLWNQFSRVLLHTCDKFVCTVVNNFSFFLIYHYTLLFLQHFSFETSPSSISPDCFDFYRKKFMHSEIDFLKRNQGEHWDRVL